MLDYSSIDYDALEMVKRALKITWADAQTDGEIWARMCRAEYTLNAKLGAETDYFSAPSWEQMLFLNYMLYAWNNCENEFDAAYQNDILQVRQKNELADMEEDDESDEA